MPAISGTIFPAATAVGISISNYGLGDAPILRDIVNEVAPNEEAHFIELMLAVNFAIRQLSNLGAGADSERLIHRLENLTYREDRGSAFLSDFSGICVNTSSPQADGGKRIDIELRFMGQSSQLRVKPSGFGFMKRRLWEHVPNSVIGLFIAVANRRGGERAFIRRLLVSALEVARQWRLGNVSLSNHAQLSLTIAVSAWSISVDGEYSEDRPGHRP